MSRDLSERNQEFRERMLEQGVIPPEKIDQAFHRYQNKAQARGRNFASYLLENGMLSLSQLATVAGEISGDTTLVEGTPQGDPLLGKYFSGCKIDEMIGRGGMGSVYLAVRESDGAEVVVKFLAAEMATQSMRARFQREAEVLKKVSDHPNIAGVLAVHGIDEKPHIVMEYVEGLSLQRVLQEKWSLPDEAIRVARDIARGLAQVHGHGIVHRDLKPANLILTPDDQVKIVDFGLAKDLFATALTRPGQRLGTPYFMAPEQWGDHDVDGRADVFALGATLYNLLVGEPPFLAKDARGVANKIQTGEYVPLRKIEPTLREDLEHVVAQMLMSDRRFRYQHMDDCAADLDRLLEGEPPRVPRLVEVGTGIRHALLPGLRFTVGRDELTHIQVRHSTVSRNHVQIRREATGFLLRDLSSTYGTFVGGMRVARPLTLKDQDLIRLGKAELEFHDPFQRERAPSAPTDQTRREIPEPVLQALIGMGDRRTSLSLIEGLTPDAIGTVHAFQVLSRLLDDKDVQAARAQMVSIAAKEQARLPMRLFALTSENLGPDPDKWLSWWEQSNANLPEQIGPERCPRAIRVEVLRGEATRTGLALGEDVVYSIGRDEDCKLLLSNRTVSRNHASLIRLHRRFAVRNDGSRLGTRLNGSRVRVAFFDHGDRLEVGDVHLTLDLQDQDERAIRVGLGLFAIDPEPFEALVALKHPAIATALVSFVHEQTKTAWIAPLATSLLPEKATLAAQLLRRVKKIYAKKAARARELLPSILGKAAEGADDTRLRQLLAQRRSDLPPQVLPVGWLEASRGLFD